MISKKHLSRCVCVRVCECLPHHQNFVVVCLDVLIYFASVDRYEKVCLLLCPMFLRFVEGT